MSGVSVEIQENFKQFSQTWIGELNTVSKKLEQQDKKFLQSYARLVSLQAWRKHIIEPDCSAEALRFFLEAQNDALVSHVLARLGSWRSALQALRSCLENVVSCLFYKDHPIELEMWVQGRYRFGFRDGWDYLSKHPKFVSINKDYNGLNVISREHATLSKAVHAASRDFRMTGDASTVLLWSYSEPSLNKWLVRESTTIRGANLLLLTIFCDKLSATRLPDLRRAVSLAIPTGMHGRVKSTFGVTL
jgi:hypothetical protein